MLSLAEIVGDGDHGGAMYGVHQPVLRVRERAVIDPHMRGREDTDSVAIRHAPLANVGRIAHDAPRARRLDVVEMDPMHDHVRRVLQREPSAPRDVHLSPAAVDGLEARHDQLLLQVDPHARGEHDPQGLLARGAVPERAGLRIRCVLVVRRRDRVDLPVLPTGSVPPESHRTVRQRPPVRLPVRVAAPAVVHQVAAPAATRGRQHS